MARGGGRSVRRRAGSCWPRALTAALLAVAAAAESSIDVKLAGMREDFVSRCVASVPRVRVITVANQLEYMELATARRYSTCTLARSLAKVGGGPLGVVGVTVSRRGTRRSKAFWRSLFSRYLGEELPASFEEMIPLLVRKFLSLLSPLLLQHLEHEEDDTLILYLDAYDTLFQRPLADAVEAYCGYQWQGRLEELLRRHAQPDADGGGEPAAGAAERIVVGAEEGCYPFPHLGDLALGAATCSEARPVERPDGKKDPYSLEACSERSFDIGGRQVRGDQVCLELESLVRGQRRFMNTGAAIGRAGDLRRFHRLNQENLMAGEVNDQAVWQLTWLRHPHLVVLDQESRIFANLHGMALDCNSFPLRVGGHTPAVLHFNGNGKAMFHRCREKLLGEEALSCSATDLVDLDRFWNVSESDASRSSTRAAVRTWAA